jgi:uncharacterized membrane protein
MSNPTQLKTEPEHQYQAGSSGSGAQPRVLAPIIVSALLSAAWIYLAFFKPLPRVEGLLFTSLAALWCGGLFTAVTASGRYWSPQPASLGPLRTDLARCSFASVVFLIFIPEYVARVPPTALRSSLLLASVAILWLTLCICNIQRARGKRLQAKTAHAFGLTAIAVLFTAVTALAIRKYWAFSYVGQDLAYFGQLMHTTLHGHLFWGNLLQDLLYSRPVTTDFAGHNSPIMFLLLPFYAVAPSPVTLIVVRNVVLFSCAIPIFFIARSRMSTTTAYLWVFAFLLTPAILYQSVFDFYPLTLVALPLLFAIYFFLEDRFIAFTIAIILTLLVREDLVFVVFGLGLLAIVRRRLIKWALLPIVAATLWAILSFLVVLPKGLHGASFVTDTCFAHLGKSPSSMLHNILHDPRGTVLIHANIVYLKTLLSPTAIIESVVNPISSLSLPYLGINLLAGGGRCITTVIYAQYSVIPATLLFVSALLTVISRQRSSRVATAARLGTRSDNAAPLLLIALSFCSLVFVTGAQQVDDLREHPWNPEARKVLALIPADASVAAPRYMLPHLANRDCLYQTHRLLEYHTAHYEYLIVDRDWEHINAAEQYAAEYKAVISDASTNPALQTIYSSPQFLVYKDPSTHGISCWPDAGIHRGQP